MGVITLPILTSHVFGGAENCCVLSNLYLALLSCSYRFLGTVSSLHHYYYENSTLGICCLVSVFQSQNQYRHPHPHFVHASPFSLLQCTLLHIRSYTVHFLIQYSTSITSTDILKACACTIPRAYASLL